MRVTISLKIFIAFLITYLFSSVLMIAMMHFYASSSFVHYMDKMVVENLDDLVLSLANEYQHKGNWSNIRKTPERWSQMTVSALSSPVFMREFPPPPMREEQRPAPLDMEQPSSQSPHTTSFAHQEDPPPPPPKFSHIKSHIQQRLSLFDSNGKHVAGNSFAPESNIYREIVVNGEVVGRIGFQKNKRPLNPPEIHFINQQLKMFSIIGGGILVLCALVSYFLTNHLMAPVHQLIKGTHAVTNLKFDTRIQVFTRDELGQLAQDFNLMAKTLERYEQMQRQWISDIAHELRTPLSIMRGEIEALQDGIRKYSPSMLDSLHDEVMNLAKTVGDLHELSLADSGALHFDQDSVAPVLILKNTLDQFQTRFKQHNITVIDRLPDTMVEYILGDGRRLRQLYVNIFENTIRYGDSPGTLTVDRQSKDNQLVLFIEDTGPGVPKKSLERIFDRLYRVDFARSRSGDGSGLGLSICKMIVEAHNGEIRAETGSMGGLKIIITLPIESVGSDRLKKKNNN